MSKVHDLLNNLTSNFISFLDFHLQNRELTFEDFDNCQRVKLGNATIALLYTWKNDYILRITAPMLGFECNDQDFQAIIQSKSEITHELLIRMYRDFLVRLQGTEYIKIEDEQDFRDAYSYPLDVLILGSVVQVASIQVGHCFYYDEHHSIRLFNPRTDEFLWSEPGTVFQVITSFTELYES